MELLTSLMPHQQTGVDKLLPLRIGALYMEMGTGKTRTALEIVKRRLDAGKLHRVLWLCPCSVKRNLAADLDKHSEGWQDVISIYGIESLSASMSLSSELYDFVQNDAQTMLIVDESNLVKNHKAIRSKRITILAEHCKYRIILNGTPISKNEADLFSQWYILDWRVLGYRSFFSFAANHLEYDPNIPGKIVRTLQTDYLISKIAPYSYQVYRKDCFTLPGKKYHVKWYSMTEEQDEHYEQTLNSMMLQMDEMKPTTIYRLFSALQAVISGMYVEDIKGHIQTSPMFDCVDDNPRIECFKDVIETIGNEKAIIFCKYTHEIEGILSLLGDKAVPFYGDISQKDRQKQLDAFAGSAQYLVANKVCAGYGLNLQYCHNVVFYSNDWDYATRIQAEDRVYRMGQDTKVCIWDIAANDTLDVRILNCLDRKERLVDALKSELQNNNDVKETIMSWARGRGGKIIGEALSEQECI